MIAKFIHETVSKLKDELIENDALDLFNNIELPLSTVLAKMELNGISIDKQILEDMKEDIKIKMELISKDIYSLSIDSMNFSIRRYGINNTFNICCI